MLKIRAGSCLLYTSAMYFIDIKDELYDKAKGFFEYELDKEYTKIK